MRQWQIGDNDLDLGKVLHNLNVTASNLGSQSNPVNLIEGEFTEGVEGFFEAWVKRMRPGQSFRGYFDFSCDITGAVEYRFIKEEEEDVEDLEEDTEDLEEGNN